MIDNFTILKGNNYSNDWNLPIPYKLKKEDCGAYKCQIYFRDFLPTQDFYSKLIGLSSFWGTRHNSIRIGWRHYEKNSIEFCILREKNKTIEVSDKSILRDFSVTSNGLYMAEINIDIHNLLVGYWNSSHWMSQVNSDNLCFLAKPYFGGTPVAPQDYYFKFIKKY